MIKGLFDTTVLVSEGRFFMTIYALPPMNKGRRHWTVEMKENKRWRNNAAFFTKMFWRKPHMNKCKIITTRHSTREPDRDNISISYKRIIDGLVDGGLILDDKPSIVLEYVCKWEKAAPKKGFVTIEVLEVIE